MPQQTNTIKVTPQAVLNFELNYFRNAVRKSNVTSRQQLRQMRSEDLRLTPQTMGAYSKRLSMNDQFSKTEQQRFIDLMA